MTIEKTGEIRPDRTPDTENKLSQGKTASAKDKKEQTKQLDDDTMNRLANSASK